MARFRSVFAALLLAASATAAAAQPADIFTRTVQVSVPGMERVTVRKDLAYGAAGMDLRMDVYRPGTRAARGTLPVVILVAGDGPPEILRNSKEWGGFTSLARLTAASGMAAVTFNHRSSQGFRELPAVAGDVDSLVAHVRRNAASLGVDPRRICLWYFSAGGLFARPALAGEYPGVRCVVGFYPVLGLPDAMAPGASTPMRALAEYAPRAPRTLLVRAGRDRPDLNAALDTFAVRARAAGAPVEVIRHDTGQHGFDILDPGPETERVVRRTLAFLQQNLRR